VAVAMVPSSRLLQAEFFSAALRWTTELRMAVPLQASVPLESWTPLVSWATGVSVLAAFAT